MKAKAWAERFQSSPPETIDQEFKAFIEEIGQVATKRGGTLNAVEGAVREQRQKYTAVCNLYEPLRHFPFETILLEFGSEFSEKAALAQKHFAEAREKPAKSRRRKKSVKN